MHSGIELNPSDHQGGCRVFRGDYLCVSQHLALLTPRVENEIVSGLKYLQVVKRSGIKGEA